MVVEGESSERVPVTSGVPQGSILGPLLFLVAFNRIFDVSLSVSSLLVGYADDTTYSKPVKCERDVMEAYRNLEDVSNWITDKGFRLQLRKTKSMLLQERGILLTSRS